MVSAHYCIFSQDAQQLIYQLGFSEKYFDFFTLRNVQKEMEETYNF